MEQTPLTVGSPQEVIEKTLSFRDYAGDYQCQMFLIDMRSGVKDRAGIARSVGGRCCAGTAQGVCSSENRPRAGGTHPHLAD